MWLKGTPPEKDYYAVIFSSTKEDDLNGYYELDDQLMEMAKEDPGFLGWENVKNGNQSIFISYWSDMEAINRWRTNETHMEAKKQFSKWYKRLLSQICKVEHTKLFEK
ncbi:MAG TPA: DUF4188 domain-containing protein [Bacteroidia bacterium]